MKKRLLLAGSLLVLVGVAVTFGGRILERVRHRGRCVVGVSLPLSGPKAESGNAILAALRMYVDERNRAGGAGGRRLELIALDDANDPAAGERNARALT